MSIESDNLAALSELKESGSERSKSHERSDNLHLVLAEVLSELRRSHSALLHKMERMEDRMTKEIQAGLQRTPALSPSPVTARPKPAPRLESDTSKSSAEGRRNSVHSMDLSRSSSQLARKQKNGTPAKEAIEMDIGQMIPAYTRGSSSMTLSSFKVPKKNLKKVAVDILPGEPMSSPAGPEPARSFEVPELQRQVVEQIPSPPGRPSVEPPTLETPAMASCPVANRNSSDGDLADTAPISRKALSNPEDTGPISRKALSNPEEPIMVSIVSARSSRFCPSSEKLNQAILSGNLTEVFRVQERGLVDAFSPRNERNDAEKGDFPALYEDHEVEDESVDWSQSRWLWLSPLHHLLSRSASKALGLMPLFDVQLDREENFRLRLRRMVSRLYHWLVLVGLIIFASWQASRYTSDVNEEDFECNGLPPLTTDLALTLSACMVLSSWGGFWSYKETTQLVSSSSQDLEDCCEMVQLDGAWKIWSCSDALLTLACWLGLMGGRVAVSLVTLEEMHVTDVKWGQFVLSLLPFAISTGILALASFHQVRSSHAMTLIINEWSGKLLKGQSSCTQLKGAWRLISGLFRKTSRTFQYCYAALAATIVLVAFTAINDARRDLIVPNLANLAVALLLPGVLVILASTTTACGRLPSLVTLVEPNDAMQETEFMELTLFLSFSECGFFVWDTSVTVGLVQKFLYFTLAVAGTMGFQSGAFRLS